MSAFPGFDIPNWDPRTVWLWQRSNLRFCVFYLAHLASGGRTPTWLPHWHDLRDSGWYLWPVWVPFRDKDITTDMPKADVAAHGRSAALAASSSGIERGATLYLDLEAPVLAGATVSTSPFAKYIRDWAIAVRAAGYRAAVYCSYVDTTVRGLAPDRLDVFYVGFAYSLPPSPSYCDSARCRTRRGDEPCRARVGEFHRWPLVHN